MESLFFLRWMEPMMVPTIAMPPPTLLSLLDAPSSVPRCACSCDRADCACPSTTSTSWFIPPTARCSLRHACALPRYSSMSDAPPPMPTAAPPLVLPMSSSCARCRPLLTFARARLNSCVNSLRMSRWRASVCAVAAAPSPRPSPPTPPQRESASLVSVSAPSSAAISASSVVPVHVGDSRPLTASGNTLTFAYADNFASSALSSLRASRRSASHCLRGSCASAGAAACCGCCCAPCIGSGRPCELCSATCAEP
mmetsp:Transcript_2776/g.10138  ORF Transcript_2776/g.10138 Transcript_2776/m.10138 type:complete len:254 (-) Transcript_2776:353-1114(-)